MRSLEGIGSLPQLKEGSLESMEDLEATPKPSPEREIRPMSSDRASGSNSEDSPPQETGGLRLLPPPKKSSPPRHFIREVSPLSNSQTVATEPAGRGEGELEIESSSHVSDIESSFEIISKLSEDTISAHSLDLDGHAKTMSEDTNSPSSHATAGVMRAHLKAASDDITTAASAVDSSKQRIGWTESQSLTTLDKVGVRARRARRPNLASVHRGSNDSRGGHDQISEPPGQGDVSPPEMSALENIISPTLKKAERKDKPKASKEQSLDEDDLFEMLGDNSVDASPPRSTENLGINGPAGHAKELSPHPVEPPEREPQLQTIEEPSGSNITEPAPRSTEGPPPQISDAPQPSSTGKPPPQSDLEDSQEVLAEFDRIVGGAVQSLYETSAGEEGERQEGVQMGEDGGGERRGGIQEAQGTQEKSVKGEERSHEEETDGPDDSFSVQDPALPTVEDPPYQSAPIVSTQQTPPRGTKDSQSDPEPPPEDPPPQISEEPPPQTGEKAQSHSAEEPSPEERPPQKTEEPQPHTTKGIEELPPEKPPEDPLSHSTKEPPPPPEDPLLKEPPPGEVGVASIVEVEPGTDESAEHHRESHDLPESHDEDFEPLDVDVALPLPGRDSLCDQSDGEETRDGGDLSDASEPHDQLKKQVSEGEDSLLNPTDLAHRLREEEEEDGER